MSKLHKKKFKRVETEEEYWREHKKMKKAIGKLFRKSYKMLNDPQAFIEKYENLLAEYEFKGVVSPEWSQQQRERLYREMNSPNEFKDWVEKGKKRLKKRAKKMGITIKDRTRDIKEKFKKK